MSFTNFIVWLTTGAIVGWFANRMVEAERKRTVKVIPVSASD